MKSFLKGIKKKIGDMKFKREKVIECPNCNNDMILNDKGIFVCESCGYSISQKLLLEDYIYWFCDNCGAYLNCQPGFNYNSEINVCTKCGFKNVTNSTNIVGMCQYCGKIIPDPDGDICDECRRKRDEILIKILQEGQNLCNDLSNLMADNNTDNFNQYYDEISSLSSNTKFNYIDNNWLINCTQGDLEQAVRDVDYYLTDLIVRNEDCYDIDRLCDNLKELYYKKYNQRL